MGGRVTRGGRFECRTTAGYAVFTDGPRAGENFADYCARRVGR
jgi:hypothetical protein